MAKNMQDLIRFFLQTTKQKSKIEIRVKSLIQSRALEFKRWPLNHYMIYDTLLPCQIKIGTRVKSLVQSQAPGFKRWLLNHCVIYGTLLPCQECIKIQDMALRSLHDLQYFVSNANQNPKPYSSLFLQTTSPYFPC